VVVPVSFDVIIFTCVEAGETKVLVTALGIVSLLILVPVVVEES